MLLTEYTRFAINLIYLDTIMEFYGVFHNKIFSFIISNHFNNIK